jgi:probable phosphoglycerate mutase
MSRPVLYFIRHGQTDWNAERRLQGQRDIPLNALGRTQSSRCGEILQDLLSRDGCRHEDLDFVSSPLGRARETMELVRVGLGLEASRYRTDARLMEMSFGRWEGYTFKELQLREAATLAARELDRLDYVVPGGESYRQLHERVCAWYAGLERDTVASAHGGVCRVLMAHLGAAANETGSTGEVGQGCIYVFAPHGMQRHE